MKVCSPIIVDEHSTTFENSTYDIEMWHDELPAPKYNQCNLDEVAGICSSGSTEQPRIVPITDQQYNVDGLDNNIQIHAKLNNTDITVNFIPLWVCIGFQTFCAAYVSAIVSNCCLVYDSPSSKLSIIFTNVFFNYC